MKDEIKEILDRFNYVKKEPNKLSYYPEDLLNREEMWLLLDYITNLQDKEKLEEIFKKYYEDEVEKNNKLQSRNIELVLERDKYKSRNEKAIEYINENSAFMNDDEWEVFNKKELLNILNGGDDNAINSK